MLFLGLQHGFQRTDFVFDLKFLQTLQIIPEDLDTIIQTLNRLFQVTDPGLSDFSFLSRLCRRMVELVPFLLPALHCLFSLQQFRPGNCLMLFNFFLPRLCFGYLFPNFAEETFVIFKIDLNVAPVF